ncbi:MAG: hypothetical protein KME22_07945 [Hassallia sp. WJT32-NPBG1]|jgi:hypothetical protein|nr:hypothetical protein [Hassallia sp. WJT32-NPBG1]
MTNSFDSRRITISYFAAEEVCKMFGLPLDVPSQALGSAVEKLIFKNGNLPTAQLLAESNAPPSNAPNKSALAAMAKAYQPNKNQEAA